MSLAAHIDRSPRVSNAYEAGAVAAWATAQRRSARRGADRPADPLLKALGGDSTIYAPRVACPRMSRDRGTADGHKLYNNEDVWHGSFNC
jgi:hypothetical protein